MTIYELLEKKHPEEFKHWDGYDYHFENPYTIASEAKVTLYLINSDKNEVCVELELKGADDGDEEN